MTTPGARSTASQRSASRPWSRRAREGITRTPAVAGFALSASSDRTMPGWSKARPGSSPVRSGKCPTIGGVAGGAFSAAGRCATGSPVSAASRASSTGATGRPSRGRRSAGAGGPTSNRPRSGAAGFRRRTSGFRSRPSQPSARWTSPPSRRRRCHGSSPCSAVAQNRASLAAATVRVKRSACPLGVRREPDR